jgi:hypothetical protein
MEAAYTDAAGRTNPDAARINLGAGILGGVNPGGQLDPLTPGVYTFGTGVLLSGDVTFRGTATDVFIIQITGNLVQAANKKVILAGGAKAANIFWQVSKDVEVGAGAEMKGIILTMLQVEFLTGSSLNGRVLTQTRCNLSMAIITEPPSRRRGLRSS